MKCPKCKTVDLHIAKLDDDLPVHGCEQCGGALVSLLSYRDWAERTYHDEDETSEQVNTDIAVDNDTRAALACAKCSKLMTKYSISGITKNRLDLCGSCDEAWLDAGEWELLKALKLSKNIPAVLSEVWQRKVREDANQAALKVRFTKILGEEDLEKAEEIRQWLKPHARRGDILFYINHQ